LARLTETNLADVYPALRELQLSSSVKVDFDFFPGCPKTLVHLVLDQCQLTGSQNPLSLFRWLSRNENVTRLSLRHTKLLFEHETEFPPLDHMREFSYTYLVAPRLVSRIVHPLFLFQMLRSLQQLSTLDLHLLHQSFDENVVNFIATELGALQHLCLHEVPEHLLSRDLLAKLNSKLVSFDFDISEPSLEDKDIYSGVFDQPRQLTRQKSIGRHMCQLATLWTAITANPTRFAELQTLRLDGAGVLTEVNMSALELLANSLCTLELAHVEVGSLDLRNFSKLSTFALESPWNLRQSRQLRFAPHLVTVRLAHLRVPVDCDSIESAELEQLEIRSAPVSNFDALALHSKLKVVYLSRVILTRGFAQAQHLVPKFQLQSLKLRDICLEDQQFSWLLGGCNTSLEDLQLIRVRKLSACSLVFIGSWLQSLEQLVIVQERSNLSSSVYSHQALLALGQLVQLNHLTLLGCSYSKVNIATFKSALKPLLRDGCLRSVTSDLITSSGERTYTGTQLPNQFF
jgi:hypothetical protein